MTVAAKEETHAGFKSRLAKARKRYRKLADRRGELVKEMMLVGRDLDQQKRLLDRLEEGRV